MRPNCPPACLVLLCAALALMLLAGCVSSSPVDSQTERDTNVEAIQTRVAEIRAAQGSAQAPISPVHSATTQPAQVTTPNDVGPTPSNLSPEQSALLAKLSPQGEAPELHNEVWLNSQPLKLADLRGQVVIVEFWTYG